MVLPPTEDAKQPRTSFQRKELDEFLPPSRATKQRRTVFQIKGFVLGWLEPLGALGGHKRMFLHVWWFTFQRPESD